MKAGSLDMVAGSGGSIQSVKIANMLDLEVLDETSSIPPGSIWRRTGGSRCNGSSSACARARARENFETPPA
jgi:hypothetical protein